MAGEKLGRHVVVVPTATENDFETAIATVAKQGSTGVVVSDRPLFVSRHDQLAAILSRYSIPAIFPPPTWPSLAV